MPLLSVLWYKILLTLKHMNFFGQIRLNLKIDDKYTVQQYTEGSYSVMWNATGFFISKIKKYCQKSNLLTASNLFSCIISTKMWKTLSCFQERLKKEMHINYDKVENQHSGV